MTDQALYQEYRPALADRLGFRFQSDETLYEWRFQKEDGFTDGTMCSEIHVKVGWLDRIRLLITGHCALKVYTKTDVPIAKAQSRSQFAVLP